ncbi:hypothetical protein AB4144_60290, partial [Rhizobiaceae sp. 2RAB30]
MKRWSLALRLAAASTFLIFAATPLPGAYAQEQAAATNPSPQPAAPTPLTEDELEVLVARIALY